MMTNVRFSMALTTAGIGVMSLRQTVDMLIEDPGRRELVCFLVAFIAFVAVCMCLAIRVWIENLEKRLMARRRDDGLMDAIKDGSKRLYSIDN